MEALAHPRALDMNMVNAQQARRVLDRLVGYELSPFLWKKVMKGLSAGRVQSVAVRLIVTREREITAFKPQEYWGVEVRLSKVKQGLVGISKGEKPTPLNPLQSSSALLNPSKPSLTLLNHFSTLLNPDEFTAKLHSIDNKPLDKFAFVSRAQVDPIVAQLKDAAYQVASVSSKEVNRNPLPPFITSTLQQEANHRLGFSAKQTMMLAQRLYEEGNITYMRTDSVNLADKFLNEAGALIKKNYGAPYLPPAPRKFTTKSKTAQEAHEAIRPTEVSRTPEEMKAVLEEDQHALYTLIWQRAVASQMTGARIRQVAVDILAQNSKSEIRPPKADPPLAENPKQIQNSKSQIPNNNSTFYILHPTSYSFRATGSTLAFDGFLRVYPTDMKETILPPLTEQEPLDLKDLHGEQHFTEPPARYSDATLVEALEKHGIGRPSTYAPTIATVIDRGYVERMDKRRLKPKDIAYLVNDLLVAHFPHIVDLGFTAQMEQSLDDIAEGQKAWVPVLREFYTPFKANLLAKEKEIQKKDVVPEETTTERCELCGAPMKVRLGGFGTFLGCSTFPKCKGIKKLASEQKTIGLPCPKCNQSHAVPLLSKERLGEVISPLPSQGGMIVEKRTRKGRTFWGCDKWPACDYAAWKNPALPVPSAVEKPAQEEKKFYNYNAQKP